MGQTRNVLVYRLLCENSVDEKVFGNIIKEEIERINAKRGNNTN